MSIIGRLKARSAPHCRKTVEQPGRRSVIPVIGVGFQKSDKLPACLIKGFFHQAPVADASTLRIDLFTIDDIETFEYALHCIE